MKHLKKIIAGTIATLFIPMMAFAVTSVGWNANSLTDTYISPNLLNGTAQAVKVPSVATSSIANLQNTFFVPDDFTTNGCAGDATKTKLDTCVEAILDLAVTKGLTGASVWFMNDVAQADWTATMDIDNNGLQVNLFCRPGVRLKYGGSGNAILINNGNPTGHVKQQIAGCTFMGQNSLIAAAQTNSTTTVGIYYGGGNGAVGFNTHDNTFNGFGTQVEVGQHAYMLEWNNNGFSGGNGTTTSRGSLVHINVANDSGERNVFQGNNFSDPGNSLADNCIYITSGGTASNFFTNNSIDNCQIYAGASNGQVAISYNHFENPGSPNSFPEYIPILNPSSDQSTQLTVIGNVFANSASNRTWTTIIKHGGQLYAASNNIQNYNGNTVTNFADHSNNNGQSADMICHTQAQGGALTNITAGGGGTTWSATNGVPCIINRANSYNWSIRPLSTNVNQFVSGNSVVADVDHSGNWNLGEDVSNSTVTINKNLVVDTNGYFGSLLRVATTTSVYPFSSFSTTQPQVELSAGAGLAKWTLRNAGGNLYFATTTVAGTATTSTPALTLQGSGVPSLTIGTTTPMISLVNGSLSLGGGGDAQGNTGTTTISMAKIQFDGMNNTGGRVCAFVVGTTMTVVSGACNP